MTAGAPSEALLIAPNVRLKPEDPVPNEYTQNNALNNGPKQSLRDSTKRVTNS